MRNPIRRTKTVIGLASSTISTALWIAALLVLDPFNAAAASQLPTSADLRGEAAVAHLQKSGAYESLAEAVAAECGQNIRLEQELVSPDGTGVRRFFGEAVAISGKTAVVRGFSGDGWEAESANTYIFVQDGTAWTLQQTLTGISGSLAISGDTLVIGFTRRSENDQSATFIYVRNGTHWSLQQELRLEDAGVPPTEWVGGGLGEVVAISADTLVIGGPSARPEGEDQFGHNTGIAFVFVRNGTSWSFQQRLVPARGRAAGELFGRSVAVDGDTVLIGTDDAYASYRGVERVAAYVYERNEDTWTQRQQLVVDAPLYFASALAIDGDTMIVGCADNNGAEDYAYIYTRTETGWTQQQRLVAPVGTSASFFGWGVGLSGETAIVGAFAYPETAEEGSVHVYERTSSGWMHAQKLTNANGHQNDYFTAYGVAISENRIIVSTVYQTVNGAERSGAVDIYKLPTVQLDITLPEGMTEVTERFTANVVLRSLVDRPVTVTFDDPLLRTDQPDVLEVEAVDLPPPVTLTAESRSATFPVSVAPLKDGVAKLLSSATVADDAETESICAEREVIVRPASIKVNITSDEPDGDLEDDVCDVDEEESGEQCSLRAAIETANAKAGPDSIVFDIPGGGIQAITPASQLPSITEKVSIDATTQPGYAGSPVIELRGDGGMGGLGFSAGSNDSSVSGLAINRFVVAIGLRSSGVKVEKCYIGLGADGAAAGTHDAQQIGIDIRTAAATNNTIGGAENRANVISNNLFGVAISEGASGNKVFGNKIGTNVAGTAAIPNAAGVAIEGANSNRVGDETGNHGNLISGNSAVGVTVRVNSSDNLIAGNKIGTNAAGTAAIPNPAGVIIESANNNRVGTDTGEHGNLVSGNSSLGVLVRANSSDNLIAGNQIGTKANGTEVLPNGQYGVFVDTGATKNTFKLNVIGGHNLTDNSAGMGFGPSSGPSNSVTGNSIGVTANGGTAALANKYGIVNFADGQEIGSQAGANFISHNTKAGIWVAGVPDGPNPVVENNVVQYNFVGTNGTDDLGNGEFGIWLASEADNNSITRNVVSGNTGFGIALTDGPSTNSVKENIVGTNTSGTSAVANGGGIWIRQATDNMVESNLVSGNSVGILVGTNIGFGETGAPGNNSGGTYTSGNRLSGNVVGLNAARNAAIPGSVIGIAIGEHARNNLIGGTVSGSDYNLIAGITQGTGIGILLGTLAPSPSEDALPQFNTLQGNIIGLAGNLRATISNTNGLVLVQAARNTIGGSSPPTGNIIVASTKEGVALLDGTRENTFGLNFFGVLPPTFGPESNRPTMAPLSTSEVSPAAGSGTYGNGGHGILLSNGAQGNILGGVNPESGLVIANNGGNGIHLASTAGSGNVIGANSIFDNALGGIDIGGDGFTPNDPGDADAGPNNLQNYPAIVSCSIIGGDLIINYQVDSAPGNSNYGSTGIYVEFFEADSSGEGRNFVGSDYYTAGDFTSGAPGTKQKNLGNAAALGISAGDLLTSDASDADGNSSEFAPSVTVTLTAVASPTPTPAATATASPSPSPGPSSSPSPTATPTPSAEPTASPSPTPATAPLQLLNISTRLNVQTGENVLIGGIIITGTEPKKVILRAIGPSLAAAIDGALQDPVLELFDGAGEPVTSNDNWRDGDAAEINASTIPPGHDAESAIVRILSPGNYTAVVSGKGGATGIGLVEVYDLATSATSQLANISSRGFVEAGDNALIGGFIAGGLEGGRPARVVVRALGPSLGEQGVNGALADPTLEIVDANGETVRVSDNWRADQASELEAIGIQPAHEAESALIATLPAGNYTAVVRGAGDTTGVGLVEVYNVP